jgi:serine/threonine protein kinase
MKVKFSIYDITELEPLGSGASGTVVLCQHKFNKKLFALKIIPLKNDEKMKNLIETEIKILHGCQCDNIIKCYASYFDQGAIKIILEFMDKGTLTDITKKVGKVPENIIGMISYQILKGIEHLHSKKIIHRDIKPSNILLNSKGQVKIADFGVSGRIDTLMNSRTTLIGTYIYMPPERIGGDNYNSISDIWSVGMSILEIAIGTYPYLQLTDAKLTDVWSLSELIKERDAPKLPEGEFSSEFMSFIGACLDKDPLTRPSATDLLKHPFIQKYEKEPLTDFQAFLASLK